MSITIGDDWESKRIKMRADPLDEGAKIVSSELKLMMVRTKYLLMDGNSWIKTPRR